MKTHQNFPDEEREENQEEETAFNDNDDYNEIEEDSKKDLLYSRGRDLKKGESLPFTEDEKRRELKHWLRDSIFTDAESRLLLSKITFEKSQDAADTIKIFYKGTEIADVNLTTKERTIYFENMDLSGYKRDIRRIEKFRNSLFIGQIENNTGTTDTDINMLIAENTKKKFVKEMQKREGLKNPTEHYEMEYLKADLSRLERGKKLETEIGREILDSQVWYTRRVVELKKALAKTPIFGILFVSIASFITAIVLLSKGFFYSASNSVQPSKKKKDQDIIDTSLQKAQEISSQILEEVGDNFEILAGIATIALIIYKRN